MVCHGSRTRLLNKTRDSHPYCEDRQDERQMREHATRDKNERALAHRPCHSSLPDGTINR
jgi:hypothetical protein